MAASSNSSTQKHTCTQLSKRFQSELLLKIDALSVPQNMIGNRSDGINSRCSFKGCDWEIRLYPSSYYTDHYLYSLALELVLVGKPRTGSVTANLSGRIVNSGDCYIPPYGVEQKNVPKEFRRPLDRSDPFYIGIGSRDGSGCTSLSLTVECTITVFKGPEANEAIPVPPSDLSRHLGELLHSQAGADVTFSVCGESFAAHLSRHLGELLHSQAGADVTFSVCGESFAAHKSVLATRSPVFMAEFFRGMKEKDAQLVEILEMDAAAFKAMLHFIYTDAVPELDQPEPEAEAMSLAQHLIVAADRYGLDRLKVMCERRLTLGMDVSTVASTLALAEQLNCSRLKAKCIEFITRGSRENLSAVLATDGFKHLVENSPLMVNELLVAAHGRKRCRSPDAN